VIEQSEITSCVSAGFREKRRELALAGKPSGRLSFGFFSLAEQRKEPRRAGARARIKINRACKALLQR